MNLTNIKICICCLTRGYTKAFMYDSLIRRNLHIKKNILDSVRANIDMLIYHEGNISTKHQRYIAQHSRLPHLSFVSVEDEFKVRTFAKSNAYCHPTDYSDKFQYGYKCMCAFWLDGFFKYTQGYDYILRIDEDCMIARIDLVDLVHRMGKQEFSYVAAMNFGRDSDACTVGLMRFIQDFCEANGLDREKANIDNCPYTNLFLMKMSTYRNSPIVVKFSKSVRESDSILINRWGDHVLWRAIISMHPGDACFFDNRIAYYHGSHFRMVAGGQVDTTCTLPVQWNRRSGPLLLRAARAKTRSFLSKLRNKVRLYAAVIHRSKSGDS